MNVLANIANGENYRLVGSQINIFFHGGMKGWISLQESWQHRYIWLQKLLIDEGIRTSCRTSAETQLLSDGYLVPPSEMTWQKLNLALPSSYPAQALPAFTWGGRGRWEGSEKLHFDHSFPSTIRCVPHLHLPVTCKGSFYVLDPCVVMKWGVVSRLEMWRVIWY